MRHVNRSALVPYSDREMFVLVDDVVAYPEFLPWCAAARVRETRPLLDGSGEVMDADLVISFKLFRERFGLHRLALHALEVHRHGYDLGLVFFGVHCAMLGALLVRSTAFPSVLGVLMALAGAGYLIGSGTLFLAPPLAPSVAPVYALPLVGELAFAGWLLVRGVRPPA